MNKSDYIFVERWTKVFAIFFFWFVNAVNLYFALTSEIAQIWILAILALSFIPYFVYTTFVRGTLAAAVSVDKSGEVSTN